MKRQIILLVLTAILSLIFVRGFQVGFSSSLHLMDGKLVSGHDVSHAEQNSCQAQDCFLSAVPNVLYAALFASSEMRALMGAFVFILPVFLFAFFVFREFLKYRKRRDSEDFSFAPRIVSTVLFRE